jgi:hypothetical protein
MSEKQTTRPIIQRASETILQSVTGAAALSGGFALLMAFRMAAFSSFQDATVFSVVLFLLALPGTFLVVYLAANPKSITLISERDYSVFS